MICTTGHACGLNRSAQHSFTEHDFAALPTRFRLIRSQRPSHATVSGATSRGIGLHRSAWPRPRPTPRVVRAGGHEPPAGHNGDIGLRLLDGENAFRADDRAPALQGARASPRRSARRHCCGYVASMVAASPSRSCGSSQCRAKRGTSTRSTRPPAPPTSSQTDRRMHYRHRPARGAGVGPGDEHLARYTYGATPCLDGANSTDDRASGQ